MLNDDIAKIRYIRYGFLPDVPYHLVSNEEMINAFLNDSGDDYFHTMYPLIDSQLEFEYNALVDGIKAELNNYLKSSGEYNIPDWVYSYMLGATVGPISDQLDRHDLFALLGTDNIDDEFNLECGSECYRVSTTWLNKYAYSDDSAKIRPATIFGEPHVIKYLRLREADALRGEE